MINIFLKTLVLTTMVMISSIFIVLNASLVYAADATDEVCRGIGATSGTGGCNVERGSLTADSLVRTVVNILSIVVGIIAIIYIIIGGIKYITSSGDANNVTSAKNTIMYAIIGLVVVALAQLIVRFVLGRITRSDSSACSSSQVWSSSEEKCIPI